PGERVASRERLEPPARELVLRRHPGAHLVAAGVLEPAVGVLDGDAEEDVLGGLGAAAGVAGRRPGLGGGRGRRRSRGRPGRGGGYGRFLGHGWWTDGLQGGLWGRAG